MRRKAYGSLLFAGALILSATIPVRAADFYLGDLEIKSDDPTITIIDPASITPSAGGNKIADIITIREYDLWRDEKLEFDCSTYQLRTLKATAYLAGGDSIDATDPTDNNWQSFPQNSQAGYYRDMVCQYPDKKPTGNDVYSADNLPAAVEALSGILSDMVSKEKK